MHEVLISLQNTLASRIAIRYAKQLETSEGFNMQAIHIPELKTAGPAPAGGWIKETWENVLIRESRDGISDLVQKEYFFHFSDSGLKTIPGREDQVILGELEERPYDFFIEGQLHAFDRAAFTSRVSSPLYRDAACPILMVKNMVSQDRGTLVLSTSKTPPPRASDWLNRLVTGLSGPLDMLLYQFDLSSGAKPPAPVPVEPVGYGGPKGADTGPKSWQGVQKVFSARGRPQDLARWASRYAMVVSVLPSSGSRLSQMLAAVSTAVLFCPAPSPGQTVQKNKGRMI